MDEPNAPIHYLFPTENPFVLIVILMCSVDYHLITMWWGKYTPEGLLYKKTYKKNRSTTTTSWKRSIHLNVLNLNIIMYMSVYRTIQNKLINPIKFV